MHHLVPADRGQTPRQGPSQHQQLLPLRDDAADVVELEMVGGILHRGPTPRCLPGRLA